MARKIPDNVIHVDFVDIDFHEKALAEKDRNKALKYYSLAFREDTHFYMTLYNSGHLLLEQMKYSEALLIFLASRELCMYECPQDQSTIDCLNEIIEKLTNKQQNPFYVFIP